MENFWTTLIPALCASIIAPSVLLYFKGRNDRKDKVQEAELRNAEKKLDWDRQDEVARLAKEAGNLAAIKTAEVAVKTDEVARNLKITNANIAINAADNKVQLKEIHTLVNSKMTEVKQTLLVALEGQYASMQESIALKVEAGRNPGLETLTAVKTVKDKITELNAEIEDRLKQAEAVAVIAAQSK